MNLEPPLPPDARCWTLDGQRIAARALQPGLHVVATPIGNLGDMTLRGLAVLAAADLILAEDTRVTHRITQHYGIATKVRRFDAHASDAQIAKVAEAVRAGQAIALVSDAGTPLLSDPGGSLVRAVVAAGGAVWPLPGASALLAGLVTSGLGESGFFFAGFLAPKLGDRRRRLRELASIPGALVFYEAPHRVAETLADMQAVLGDRQACAARELTKLHEEVVRGPLSVLSARFASGEPRGEFVLIIGPPAPEAAASADDVNARLTEALKLHSVKDAAALVAAETGLPRREAYARALRLAR
jgi:16S rRNA (cytidine1402-2'-O)-methyltransferase